MAYNDGMQAALLDAFDRARNEVKDKKNDRCGDDDKRHDNDRHEDKDCDCDQGSGEWYDIQCCEKHEHKEFEVYTPVSVKPYVHLYKPEAKCEGEMKAEPGCKRCKDGCKEYEFTLEQKLSIDVPVKYGVIVRYCTSCAEEEE